MEKEGLRRCLDSLLANNVQILSIVTDRHRGVGSLMKKEYPFIKHQFDVWHLAKNVVKKLTQKGKQKHCEQLLPWIQSISNHLWWSAQTYACNGMRSFSLTSGYPLLITSVMFMNGLVMKVVNSLNVRILH